jgi:hypothetical protein
MVHRSNLLLSRLDPPSLARMIPYMNVLQLEQGKILAEAHQPVLKVYFPHGGIISSVVELIGGEAIETAMVGRDGVFGASQALDGKLSLNHVVIQVPGIASIIESARLCELARKSCPCESSLSGTSNSSWRRCNRRLPVTRFTIFTSGCASGCFACSASLAMTCRSPRNFWHR